ncbi:MAG: alpha/beta hydrolase [Castellaniella sp.]|uniref:alpha/beta hydrolase n=1 Tax=Castellaniella sp. TaxID=1955812 RepID=UPI003A88205A
MSSYVMSVRAVRDNAFTAHVGETRYLVVPDGKDPGPSHAVTPKRWFAAISKAAVWKNAQGERRGDLLFSVHGYNMSSAEVIERHRRLADGLTFCGFKGVVVSFDWPSDDKALAYLSDRHNAKMTAMKLMSDGIAYLSASQRPDCPTNIHVLGHSTGAFVIREAFDDADDTSLENGAWSVSQVVFAAGDVSSHSMSAGESGAQSIYRHCVRVTNYSSKRDQALDLSNVKRIGTAPRVGRVGLPQGASAKAVNIDCTAYYEQLETDAAIQQQDEPEGIVGMRSHSWYFGNRIFTRDLFCTLIGSDRQSMSTRTMDAEGRLMLVR